MPAQNSFIVVNNTMYAGLQKVTPLFTVLHGQTDKQGSPPMQDQCWSHPLPNSHAESCLWVLKETVDELTHEASFPLPRNTDLDHSLSLKIEDNFRLPKSI